MTKESFTSVNQPTSFQKSDSNSDLNTDEDLYEGGEFVSLSESLDEESTKKNARRKIEIYLEKKTTERAI
jgi:hypothetical protein